jgi:NAD-dependent SIR2 family protein deacetylase
VPKKKNSPKTTLNVDAIKRDSKKVGDQISKANPELFGRELDPGTSRRESALEQEMGSAKYKNMIHEHNDKNKHILDRLPFTFPKKSVVRSHRSDVLVECVECGYQSYGSEHTYMKMCDQCKKSTKVINPEAEARGEDRDFTPGFLATASDILEMREKRRKEREEQDKKKD